jgi:hypothetical protein
MSAYLPCSECDGTGWILYRAETVDGELEEAYRLCPKYCAPRYCMSKSNGLTCPRPSTVRYGLRRYFCKEHIEVVCADEDVNRASEAINIPGGGCR